MKLKISYGQQSFSKYHLTPVRRLYGLLFFLGILYIVAWKSLPSTDLQSYFGFADGRSFFGVVNALDVLSNLGFLLVGANGIFAVLKNRARFSRVMLFLGIALSVATVMTCLGSMFFHWNPNAENLFWDRLPMTLGFSTVVAIVVADRVDEKIALWILGALVFAGLYSIVGYGRGWVSLRPYAALQFGSVAFVALAALVLPQKHHFRNASLWFAVFWYSVAKVFEAADRVVFDVLGVVSGHTLKHLFAALAIYRVLEFTRITDKRHIVK
jgi:hypothetical protein